VVVEEGEDARLGKSGEGRGLVYVLDVGVRSGRKRRGGAVWTCLSLFAASPVEKAGREPDRGNLRGRDGG
jgi:hypothetical protein